MREPDETLPDDDLAPEDESPPAEDPADVPVVVSPLSPSGLRAIAEEAGSTKGIFSPEFVKMIGDVFPEKDALIGLPAGTMSMIHDVISTQDLGLGLSKDALTMFRDVATLPDWLQPSIAASELYSQVLADASSISEVLADTPLWMAPAFRITEQIDSILSDTARASATPRGIWSDTLTQQANMNGALVGFTDALRPLLEDLSARAWLGPVLGAASWQSAIDSSAWDLQVGFPPGLWELVTQLPFADIGLLTAHLPPNWVDVDADLDDVEATIKIILEEAIPLGWVPSARVIELLLEAPNRSARRRVILNNHRGILTDCEDIASGLSAPGALGYADSIRRAIRALRDGHADAAQALASNILETIVTHHTTRATTLAMAPQVLTNASSYKRQRKLGWRILLSLYPLSVIMGGKHTPFSPTSDYRRNATVHAVTRQQYTRTNAVLAIMNATAVLACYVRDTEAFD